MITKIQIENFRNIKNETYDLNKLSFICGKNFTGKTNILNAICWVLTDKLLNNNNDLASIKPTNNKKAEVAVTLFFDDNTSIKKTYKENWVTTRGTNEEKLSGHLTKIFINDTLTPISEANKIIAKDFLKIDYQTNSKIDLSSAFVDPLYLFENINWKDLRTFLIELVGDAKIEDIAILPEISNNKFLPNVLERLEVDKGNMEKTTKFFKDVVKKQSEELDGLKIILESEKRKVDVDPDVLLKAQQDQKELLQLIQDKQKQKETFVNPLIEKYQKEINEIKFNLLEIENDEQEKYNKILKDIDSKNKEINDLININNKNNNDIHIEKMRINSAISNNEFSIKANKNTISRNENEMQNLRNDFVKVNDEKFKPFQLPEKMICKNCGAVLNAEILESIKQQNEKAEEDFEVEKIKKLQTLNEKGKSLKLQNEQLNLEIQEIEKEIINLKDSLKTQDEEEQKVLEKINLLKSQLIKYPEKQEHSKEYFDLLNKQNEVKLLLENEKQNNNNSTDFIDNEILELKNKLVEIDPILAAHEYYLATQKNIKQIEVDIENKLTLKANDECKLMLCEDITTTKLRILKENVKRIFNDDEIEIQLVESNIKEGSWNEVCYPIITDEKTGAKVPFENASRSQKYINAIKIIECIKKATNSGENAPLLIDEIGTFDNDTINKRIVTNSQIIATKCDDNFEKPTIKFM